MSDCLDPDLWIKTQTEVYIQNWETFWINFEVEQLFTNFVSSKSKNQSDVHIAGYLYPNMNKPITPSVTRSFFVRYLAGIARFD